MRILLTWPSSPYFSVTTPPLTFFTLHGALFNLSCAGDVDSNVLIMSEWYHESSPELYWKRVGPGA